MSSELQLTVHIWSSYTKCLQFQTPSIAVDEDGSREETTFKDGNKTTRMSPVNCFKFTALYVKLRLIEVNVFGNTMFK